MTSPALILALSITFDRFMRAVTVESTNSAQDHPHQPFHRRWNEWSHQKSSFSALRFRL
jgi:hypothetical protein